MQTESKLKILFIHSDPTKELDLDSEYKAIESIIKASKYSQYIDIKLLLSPSFNEMVDAMNEQKPHIIHFAGHSTQGGAMVYR